MKHFSIFLLALAGLAFACCTKADNLNPEEQAAGTYWYNKIQSEVLYIDKAQSAFILQGIGINDKEDGTPAEANRNGNPITLPYTLEGNHFVFKEGYYIRNGFTGLGVAYEEAWFDAVGNLIVQMGNYIPNGEKYNKDPRPDGTWEVIYTRKDLKFIDQD